MQQPYRSQSLDHLGLVARMFEEPDAHVIHITQGYSRDYRPDLNPVMLDLIVEHQAGIPLLMPPLSGNTSDAIDFRYVVTEPITQLHTTYGTAYLVADSALYNEENLQPLTHTRRKWITRVPATVSEAQAALADADPATMIPLTEGYPSQVRRSTYGGVAQRWALIYSDPPPSSGAAHGREASAQTECRRSQNLPEIRPHRVGL